MITTDKKDFARVMIACFQNYRANVAPELIDEWFESKLKQFPFFAVRKAFVDYVDDYKNKFPPQRGQIIQLAFGEFSGNKKDSSEKNGCVNLIVGKPCGEEIMVHGHCESCYDAKRPKNESDHFAKKNLQGWIAMAKSEGCVTESEIGEWSRKRMGMTEMGQVILALAKNDEASSNQASF